MSIKLKLFEKKFIGTHGQENYRAPEMLTDKKYDEKIEGSTPQPHHGHGKTFWSARHGGCDVRKHSDFVFYWTPGQNNISFV